ncbi:MAG: c-type cytochrome [Steroidobacteraceae bacterium]
MKMRTIIAATLAAAAAPAFAADANFDFCFTCHGDNLNGNVAIHAPRIAGLEGWYIQSQLTAFKNGWRGAHEDDAPGNEMRPVGEHLSDAEVKQLLSFVRTLTPKAPPVTVTGNVEHGKELYATCASCHGAAGEGNELLHAPALAARTDWYLVKQLQNYRAGIRGARDDDTYGQQMRIMAANGLGDDAAVDDVVAYINTLR